MLKEAVAITAKEIELMLAARFIHSRIILDRMRLRHLRQEFVEEMRFGLCPVQGFVADKGNFIPPQPLRAKQQFKNSRVGPPKVVIGRLIFWCVHLGHRYLPDHSSKS